MALWRIATPRSWERAGVNGHNRPFEELFATRDKQVTILKCDGEMSPAVAERMAERLYGFESGTLPGRKDATMTMCCRAGRWLNISPHNIQNQNQRPCLAARCWERRHEDRKGQAVTAVAASGIKERSTSR